MICPNCGSNNPEGTRFCVGCGTKLEGAVPPPPAYQQPPKPSYQQPTYQQQNYQPNYQQPGYQQPYQNIPAVNPNTMPMRTGEFFWMIFILGIPLVGFICSLVWAFGSNVNENRRNYCRAVLIWMIVGICISIIIALIAVATGSSLMNLISNSSYYY